MQEMLMAYTMPRRFPLRTLERVIDGDTFCGVVCLGFDLSIEVKFRMARIDTPELPTPEGLAAKHQLQHAIEQVGPGGFDVLVHGKDKYGRWLAELVKRTDGLNINDWMVQQGYAKYV